MNQEDWKETGGAWLSPDGWIFWEKCPNMKTSAKENPFLFI